MKYGSVATMAAFIVVVGFAWAALKLYDEPIRRALKPLTRA